MLLQIATTTLDRCYTKYEREKVRAYGQRVRQVERATFVPLVSIDVYHRWSRQTSNQFLQAIGIPPCRQVGATLQCHFVLAAMFLILQSAAIRHPGSTYVVHVPQGAML